MKVYIPTPESTKEAPKEEEKKVFLLKFRKMIQILRRKTLKLQLRYLQNSYLLKRIYRGLRGRN